VWMKKRYVLKFDDLQHHTVVARRGSETEIHIGDGEALPVDAHTVLGGKAFSLQLGNRMHLVHLSASGHQGEVTATLDGRPVSLTVMDELKAQALESLGEAAGSGTISAEIPGLVYELLVKEGQKVHKGAPVIIVEAMKMQNELCAAVSGTVTSIPVEAGQAVNPGDALIVIDPEPGE